MNGWIFRAGAALALISAQVPAQLPTTPVAGADTAPPSQAERDRLTALIDRAVSAGRAEIMAPERNDHRSADARAEDRRDTLSQFAMLLYQAVDCAAAAAFIREQTEIRASGIDRLVGLALLEGKRECATSLAPLMLERWDDPSYTPAGRIAMRFKAGALLDAAANPAGRDAMKAAEAELLKADAVAIWKARFDAVEAYAGTPALNRYLDYLADRMAADPESEIYQRRRGVFITFAANGRCDLVERVTRAGPASCDKPKADADSLYVHPSPSLVA
ncbi:MAG: hypothetical protein JWR80_1324, partial [Bradyrhizobium sp.]|nr:hypothetical protein [Bradyrhizobium sp.]